MACETHRQGSALSENCPYGVRYRLGQQTGRMMEVSRRFVGTLADH